MPGLAFPPFPDNIPTHLLIVFDYELINIGDPQEINKFWKAATELGFWYLKNHGAVAGVECTFDMGAETMDLPLEKKTKFEQGDEGKSFGLLSRSGLFTTSSLSISPGKMHWLIRRSFAGRCAYGVNITPFVRKSLSVIDTTLSIFEKKLELPAGTLLKPHSRELHSGSEARAIKSPPKHTNSDGPIDKDKVALGAHTDFGPLLSLHNRLGGLQVLPPNSPDWQYVRPIPGHAICNIGDAPSLFSGGILRSNIHRIVPPPEEQGAYTRWSAVFFSRPGGSVRFRALDESYVVKDALSHMTPEDRARFDPNVMQGEWYARRMKNTRVKNRTGPETYRASRGMEHKPHVI